MSLVGEAAPHVGELFPVERCEVAVLLRRKGEHHLRDLEDGDEPSAADLEPGETPAAADRAEPSKATRQAGGSPGWRLGDLLVERGLVTTEQVEQALVLQRVSGHRLGEVLIDMGVLGERGLVDALAEFFDMPVADLRTESPEAEATALVPEEIARQHLAVPIRVASDGLQVAAAEPTDELRFLLAETTGRPVRLMLAPVSDIRRAIDTNYRAIGGVDKLVQAFEAVEFTRRRAGEAAGPEVVPDDAPVVQVVNRILTQAIRDRASDVHIEPQGDERAGPVPDRRRPEGRS